MLSLKLCGALCFVHQCLGVFESTTAGLLQVPESPSPRVPESPSSCAPERWRSELQASLQAVPGESARELVNRCELARGASAFTTCGAVTYSKQKERV